MNQFNEKYPYIDEMDTLAKRYIEWGSQEGFDSIWSDAEKEARAVIEPEVAFVHKTVPKLIEQVQKRINRLVKRLANLQETHEKLRQVIIDGMSIYYQRLILALWWLIVAGEYCAFPYLYRNVFGQPLYIGFLFAALFPGASLLIHSLHYKDRIGDAKQRTRAILIGLWGVTMLIFIPSFITAQSLVMLPMQSLALSGGAGVGALSTLRLISLIGLWLLGLTTSTSLAILHTMYWSPQDRVTRVEKEMAMVKQTLDGVTVEQMALIRKQEEANAMVERHILALKNILHTLINQRVEQGRVEAELEAEGEQRWERKQERKRARYGQHSPSNDGNGQIFRHTFNTLTLIIGLLLYPWTALAGQHVFLVQDLSRPSQVVEQDFQGFGRLVLNMPVGTTITVFGSDGKQRIQGYIDGDYRAKVVQQRNTLIEQGRQLYQQIQQHPSNVRDYASALAEIIQRLTNNAILIIQGKPLYRLDPIDWEGRVPSISWAFNSLSPFGETALRPARTKFRVAIVFQSHDFVTPIHRAEIERFWTILFHRLDGRVVLFTSDPDAVVSLFTAQLSSDGKPAIPDVSEAERNAPLQLRGVTILGVSK